MQGLCECNASHDKEKKNYFNFSSGACEIKSEFLLILFRKCIPRCRRANVESLGVFTCMCLGFTMFFTSVRDQTESWVAVVQKLREICDQNVGYFNLES